jgi:hypothetical protein
MGADPNAAAVYGDPAWLISRFHRPVVNKHWDLGIVFDFGPPLVLPESMRASVRVIDARTATDLPSVKAKLHEILSCRRVLSIGLSGAIVAEAYGIPSLPFVAAPGAAGSRRVAASAESGMNPEVADLYAGLRLATLPVFTAETLEQVDWAKAIRAIDTAWNPVWFREDDLLGCFPLDMAPAPQTRADAFDAAVLAAPPPAPTAPRPTASRPVRPGAASLQDWVDEHQTVPLGWAATSLKAPYPNLGDALSAVVTAAIAGLPIERRNFDDSRERLVAVGTIGHAQRNGIAHLWGTGLDATRNAFDPALKRFAIPPATRLVAHAMRGRNSAARLREAGIVVPEVYGDPVSFMPKLLAGRTVQPTHELGIVLHITELTEPGPSGRPLPEYRRYQIPPSLAGVVRIINTYTANDTASLLARVDDIRACKRIASTSFHGLVIPESFGIPNVWFSTQSGEGMLLAVDDDDAKLDHRIRDWYSGTGRQRVIAYGSERHLPTRWDQLIRFIDRMWEPLRPDVAPLFDAFPLRPRVSMSDPVWTLDPAITDAMRF